MQGGPHIMHSSFKEFHSFIWYCQNPAQSTSNWVYYLQTGIMATPSC